MDIIVLPGFNTSPFSLNEQGSLLFFNLSQRKRISYTSILMNLKNSYDSEDILVILHVLEYEKLFLKVSFVCMSVVKTSVP